MSGFGLQRNPEKQWPAPRDLVQVEWESDGPKGRRDSRMEKRHTLKRIVMRRFPFPLYGLRF